MNTYRLFSRVSLSEAGLKKLSENFPGCPPIISNSTVEEIFGADNDSRATEHAKEMAVLIANDNEMGLWNIELFRGYLLGGKFFPEELIHYLS